MGGTVRFGPGSASNEGFSVTAPLLVADSSVVITWLHKEGEEYAGDCLRLAGDFAANRVKIVVPDLFFMEIANFVTLKHRRMPELWAAFEALTEFDFERHTFGPEDHLLIASAAQHHGLTAYDAAYFHLADILGIPLYSKDERLVKAWSGRPGGHIRLYGRNRKGA
jgi:predicted nucleic acid-binding protein